MQNNKSNIAIIANPLSRSFGKDTEAAQAVLEHFAQKNAAKLFYAKNDAEIIAQTKQALKEGFALIAAAGGDGTVSAVGAVLVNTEATLGVVPVGTLNHFAKDLQIPNTLDESLAVLLEGKAVLVDVGEVNGEYFLNNLSIGLYPAVVAHRIIKQMTGWNKWIAFAWSLLYHFIQYPYVNVKMKVDGQGIVRQSPILFIGNNIYHLSGLRLGSRTSLQFTATEISIDTQRPRLQVAIDGELRVLETPILCRIRPGALRVQIP